MNQKNILNSSQSSGRSCCDRIEIKNQIVKLAIFVLITVIIASITITGEVSYDQQYYFLQNKIIRKNSRGIFPPLSGNLYSLYGTWNFLIQIGQQTSNLQKFKFYKLIFQKSGDLTLIKEGQNCTYPQNRLDYTWKAFSFNLKISEKKSIIKEIPYQKPEIQKQPQENGNLVKDEPQMTFENSCFSPEEEILEYIESFTVWTFSEGNLYLLCEKMGEKKIENSIFVLKKKSN